jgi:CheY-like chemotaxis protein
MKRIIIVDDDPGVQSAFSLIFDPELYEVVVYSNGNELLNNQFEAPDLFILDKQLSGVDGLDICRLLKSQPFTCNIPVLIISASPNIANLAVQAGADGFIEKPFSIMEIREMVMKFVM